VTCDNAVSTSWHFFPSLVMKNIFLNIC
jgi:hypothetical protein